MSFFKKILFEFLVLKINKSIIDSQKYLTKIKENEWYFISLSNDQLRKKTVEFKTKLVKKTKKIAHIIYLLRKQAIETEYNNINTKESIYKAIKKKKKYIINVEEALLLELLPEAFSVMKETAKRFLSNNEIFVQCSFFDRILFSNKTYVKLYKDKAIWKNTWNSVGKSIVWDMVYYDAQLIGGIVLHHGKIAEMATGEGKTLVATLAIYLNALTGRGVHVVTVNDFLARRDYAWMAPLMEFHGLSVDCIENHPPNTFMRRKAYAADITYGTNNEFVFDYLRDNIVHTTNEVVQRELHYAIVDEIDSVLIDEGRTPIIISVPFSQVNNKEFEVLKLQVEKIIHQQRLYLSKTLNEARELILLGNNKKGGFKLLQVYRGFPKNTTLIKFLSNENIRSLLHKIEVQYMQDNDREMAKIDENLYFVVNEKNNSIELTDKGINLLSTYIFEQDLFILHDITREIKKIEYQKLSQEEENNKKEEILKDYYAKSARIHTINQLLKAYILFEKNIDYIVLEGQVKIVDKQTGRIMESHRYSNGLHQAIESKENVKIKEESQPIAMITLKNFFCMYRKLAGMTGTAETYSGEFWHSYKLDVVVIPTHKPIYRKDYQDNIFKTKREKYNAIIEEIIKISQYERRPVLVGTTSVEVSEFLSRMLKIRKISHNVLNAKLHKKEANIIAESGKSGIVTIATNMAGRGTDIKLSSESKVAGGLAILGVEHHYSRRVDRQLRGRSGRQGDPGSSKFFVSLEDSLMRLFGSYRISKLMDRLGYREGDLLHHSMITNSIESAQKKLEENNFDIKKLHHKYDEIVNQQREVIYIIRKNAIFVNRISGFILSLLYQILQTILKKSIELEKHFELIFFF
jgi:preprotein translocase subunit SecA